MANRQNNKSDFSHPVILGVLVAVFGGILAYALVSYSDLSNGGDISLPVVRRASLHPEAQAILDQPDNRLRALEQQSAADDVASLEADLEATVLSDLDAETSKVLNELQGL